MFSSFLRHTPGCEPRFFSDKRTAAAAIKHLNNSFVKSFCAELLLVDCILVEQKWMHSAHDLNTAKCSNHWNINISHQQLYGTIVLPNIPWTWTAHMKPLYRQFVWKFVSRAFNELKASWCIVRSGKIFSNLFFVAKHDRCKAETNVLSTLLTEIKRMVWRALEVFRWSALINRK